MNKLFCIAALTAFAVGCGGKSARAPVVPTRGAVTMDGKPAAGALLIFHPDGAAAKLPLNPRARVRSDGSFVAETYSTGDGVPAGAYVVTVEWRTPTVQESEEGEMLAPAQYTKLETSPVKLQIVAGPDGACALPPIRMTR